MENRELSQVLGTAPFQTYLYDHFATVTSYFSRCHGSLANYIAITSGSKVPCSTTSYRVFNLSSLGPLAGSKGESWISYEQGMPKDCAISDSGSYLVRHNPFVWYRSIVRNSAECDRHDVPLGTWNASTNAVHNFTFLAPNVTNDCHSANETVCDSWLRGFLNPVLNDSKRMKSTLFFIWYDEGTTSAGYNASITGGHTYLVAVCGPCAGHHFTENATDFNVITTVEWLLGLPSLGHLDNATLYPAMKSLLGK
jgi:hypothetical protein